MGIFLYNCFLLKAFSDQDMVLLLPSEELEMLLFVPMAEAQKLSEFDVTFFIIKFLTLNHGADHLIGIDWQALFMNEQQKTINQMYFRIVILVGTRPDLKWNLLFYIESGADFREGVQKVVLSIEMWLDT